MYKLNILWFNPFCTRAKKIDRTYFFIENIYFMTLIHQIEKKIDFQSLTSFFILSQNIPLGIEILQNITSLYEWDILG